MTVAVADHSLAREQAATPQGTTFARGNRSGRMAA